MNYRNFITIEPDKRGGKPCIRRMRITVYDVLGWLAAGMSHTEILEDFPDLTEEDIRACLEFASAESEAATQELLAISGLLEHVKQNQTSPKTEYVNWRTVRSNG
jgi:uncharacterized protein (DUF433 family)